MRWLAALAAAPALLAGAACTTTRTDVVEVMAVDAREQMLRSATNLPAGFVVLTPSTTSGGCPPRLRDSGMDATLTLVRAVNLPQSDSAGPAYLWTGDYDVDPISAYGGVEGDGLRVDCSRLRPLGLVQLDGAVS